MHVILRPAECTKFILGPLRKKVDIPGLNECGSVTLKPGTNQD